MNSPSIRLLRRVGYGLLLAAFCFASSARADALSEGKRAFSRKDYVRAAPLLRLAAERGSPAAQTYLGYMRQYGLGVTQDYVIAAGWLHEAAEQGEPTAQFLLGLLFDKGYGVPKDWVEAEVWLNRAAANASPKQRAYWIRVRNAVAQKLTLDQIAEAQRRASDWAPLRTRRRRRSRRDTEPRAPVASPHAQHPAYPDRGAEIGAERRPRSRVQAVAPKAADQDDGESGNRRDFDRDGKKRPIKPYAGDGRELDVAETHALDAAQLPVGGAKQEKQRDMTTARISASRARLRESPGPARRR